MVSNIDDNIGKLFKKLKELEIEKNTIIIFMTDNGPQQTRYIAGMRGKKGSVFRGGVRVPFFIKYPALIKNHKTIETPVAHIDILPTISKLCNVKQPMDRVVDGKNLLPLINDKQVDWQNRSLFFYWTRRYPELYNNMAIQKGKYKLIGNANYNASIKDFELFNINEDPYEQYNIIKENEIMAEKLKSELDHTYKELINSKNLKNQPRIVIGSQYENPLILNRNDAGGERGIWNQEDVYGKWRVQINEGHYNIKFKFIKPVKKNGKMYLETNTIVHQMRNENENENENQDIIEMKNVYLSKMDCDFIPFYAVDSKRILPFWVEIEKLNETVIIKN